VVNLKVGLTLKLTPFCSSLASLAQNKNEWGWGWDAGKMVYGNLIEAGVIDPAKVTINALENSASVAGLVLTTECLVTEIPIIKTERMVQDEFDAAGMNAGMAGV
jgi:chaperonin GroEL